MTSRPRLRMLIFAATLLVPLLTGAKAHSSPPVPHPETLIIKAGQQFDFAEQLFQKGEDLPAVTEYQRFIHFFPEDGRVFEARHKIARAYFRHGDYAKAIEASEQILKTHKRDDALRKAYLMISRCYVRQQAYPRALGTLAALIAVSSGTATRDEAYYESGWIQITLCNWSEARRAFNQISAVGQIRYRLADLVAAISPDPELAYKDPHLAGTLALLPGAGYLYTQRPRDALLSFGLCGGAMYAAYEAFDHDNNALGVLLGLVGLGFYSGSIYGSVNSAHKFNRRARESLVEKLKQRHRIILSAGPLKGGGLLALRLQF